MATSEFEQEGRKKTFRKVLVKILVILLILCAIGAGAYFVYVMYISYYGSFSSYEVVTTIEKTDATSTLYKGTKGNLLKYSRDGIMEIDETGKYLWNGSYEMKDPIVDTCGDYVAVADRGSKTVYIFDDSGVVNDITVEQSILQVQVANQGVVAVLMEEDNVVYINLYESDGDLITWFSKPIEVTGFPISMALSNDGTKMVYACLDVTSGEVKTDTAWYNFGDVGQNENKNFVGGLTFDSVVAKVDFITNDLVCIYKDDGFELYSMEEKPAETPVISETFENNIQSIFSNSSYIGFVLDTAEEEYKYRVVVYDTKGNKVLEKNINFDYSGLNINDTDIIFYNYSECMVLSIKGKVRFQYQFTENIDAIYGASSNKFYLVSSNKIDIIRLKGAK